MTHTLRALVAATVTYTLVAAPAAAQATTTTVSLPLDPNGSYVGPFAPAGVGLARFAQTFERPGAGFDLLRQFTVNLGDFNTDGSGRDLRFRAGIFTVNGGTLGTQLFLSDERSGSGAASPGFDPFTFTTSGLRLDPTMTTFAILLQATATQDGAANVIAGSAAAYANGGFFAVDADGNLIPLADFVPQSAFTAVFDAAPASTVPEPGTVVLVAGGLAGVAAFARRRST